MKLIQESLHKTVLVKITSVAEWTISISILTICHVVSTSLIIPNQAPYRYIQEGDINIGGIISGMDYTNEGKCADTLYSPTSYHFSEAIAYAVNEVNNKENLLPNVTLGFFIVDDCRKESIAAIQAVSFIKQTNRSKRWEFSDTEVNETCSLMSEEIDDDAGVDVLPMYDVVGVIGCLRTPCSISASLILGQAQVPLISFVSSSETLNNRAIHPYFMRVIPSDSYLVSVLVKLLDNFGWRYFSVVYDEGDFGENAFQTMRKETNRMNNVCIATYHVIYQTSTYEDFKAIVKDLYLHKNARVVIVLTEPPSVIQLLKASHELAPKGWFFWLGNESWKIALGGTSDENIIRSAAGCLVVGFQALMSRGYNNYLLQMDPSNITNPWLARSWEDNFKCPISDPACVSANKLSSLPGLTTFTSADNAYEAVLTYAHGIQSIINSKCPNKTGMDVRDCITGPDLLGVMRSLKFCGPTGLVEFDNFGSVLAKFHVEQILPLEDFSSINITQVAIFYTGKSKMYYIQNISFEYIREAEFVNGVPVSVCSKPCGPGQFKIPRDSLCCWECRPCRSNEILDTDFTTCFVCPQYKWPDPQSNFTMCEYITPEYPQIHHPMVVVCMMLSTVGIIGVGLIALAFFRYRNVGIIKASGRELSCLQLLAICTGYITMTILTMKPSTGSCNAAFFLYCISFALLYAPLLVKAIRIHRIFTSGKRSNIKVKYISPKSQILFTFILVSFQMFLCTIATIMYKPSTKLTQPVRTEKFVQISCEWTVIGHGSFLAYNVILVFLCSVFAFKTRNLPDNFNESKFITLCVYTTLIIWGAFIPAYYTTEMEYVKTLLLALSLLVNHSIVVLFLYLPKIYAAVNLIPTTSISAVNVDENLRRDSAVSSTHNSRFLSGLTEVLNALRFSPSTGKSALGSQAEIGSIEYLSSTKGISPRKAFKKSIVSKIRPVDNQETNEIESSSTV